MESEQHDWPIVIDSDTESPGEHQDCVFVLSSDSDAERSGAQTACVTPRATPSAAGAEQTQVDLPEPLAAVGNRSRAATPSQPLVQQDAGDSTPGTFSGGWKGRAANEVH